MNKTGNKLYVHRTKHNIEMSTPLCKTTFITHSKQTIWMAAWVSTFYNVFLLSNHTNHHFWKLKKNAPLQKKKNENHHSAHTTCTIFWLHLKFVDVQSRIFRWWYHSGGFGLVSEGCSRLEN